MGRNKIRTGDTFLAAARVPETLQPQACERWSIERHAVPALPLHQKWAGWPSLTLLRRIDLAANDDPYAGEVSCGTPGGETVMEDSRRELSRHLPIWLAARGEVLVTGLGLGCVVRGLLANPLVRRIDVVEIDEWILRVVGAEFVNTPRVVLHHGDALSIDWLRDAQWDFAWHDIWATEGLQVLHAQLLERYDRMVRQKQGAWMFPRWAKRRAGDLLGGERRAR